MNLDPKQMKDAEQANAGFEPVPEGWYQAQITEEKEASTKNGGVQLVLTFNILGKYEGTQLSPSYLNRKVWSRYNVRNNSIEAVRIAYSRLQLIIAACNLPSDIPDSKELLNKVCDVYLTKVEEAGYNPSNEIKKARACVVSAPNTQIYTDPIPQERTSNVPWGRH